jgi:hypothetical protein
LQTGLIAVEPEQVFTLLFDVSALSTGSGSGGTLFLNTLEPAPVLFTDSDDNPVEGISVLGDSIVVGQANFLLWDDKLTLEWQAALAAGDYRIYRGTGTGLPDLLDGSENACLELELSDTITPPILDEEPLPGTFFWYLVTGLDDPTEGSAGDGTAGPRVVNSIGPCP